MEYQLDSYSCSEDHVVLIPTHSWIFSVLDRMYLTYSSFQGSNLEKREVKKKTISTFVLARRKSSSCTTNLD